MSEPQSLHLSPQLIAQFNNNPQGLQKAFADGQTPQQVIGFSQQAMAELYRGAYLLFQQHEYAKATEAFLFLATLNVHNHDYWLGLGMSTQMCHHYEEAIDAYEMAALCDLASPIPYFYLAKCLFAIHDRASALQAIELAIEMADDNDEYADLKQQAKAAQRTLIDGI